jgi:glycosyltransferase involved in cell wall biosynthesis
LIHLNGYAHGALAWTAPVLMAGHDCRVAAWEAVRRTPPPIQWSEYVERVRAGLQSAEMVVAPTRALLHDLQHHHGPLPRSRVIAHGRDLASFGPGHKEPFILSSGGVCDETKNIAVLAAAASRLIWPVLVAGECTHTGGVDGKLDPLIQTGPLPREELAEFYGRASIYALPALYEPFGLAVLEAALSGCALVLSDLPSLRENWEGAALFVPAAEADAWGTVLNELAQQPDRRRSLGAQAQARARYFTPERLATRYLAAYAALRRQTKTNRGAARELVA